jgi:hypothetical protein
VCKGGRVVQMVSAALTKAGSFGPDKMEALLDKHERTNCVGLESSASERDGVPPAQENPFNGDSRTCDRQFRSKSHELK